MLVFLYMVFISSILPVAGFGTIIVHIVCVRACMCTCACMRVRVCMCVRACVHVRACVYAVKGVRVVVLAKLI